MSRGARWRLSRPVTAARVFRRLGAGCFLGSGWRGEPQASAGSRS
jgi:hypothetical protein